MINQRYIIGKKLGEGRSKVYSVIDTDFPEREVAAKFLPASASIEERNAFRDEFFTLQKLDHPHIIKSFEISTVLKKDDDEEIELSSPFITLENFASTELLDYADLKDERKLIKIIKQICSVLYYLHQSNYIYYDLKPQNILVTEIDGEPFIKIIDLGLSQYILAEYEPAIKGTAYYIAPELLKNEIHDHSVDFYALGIMLYRIVFGKFPFNSENELEIYKEHIEHEFVLPESNYSDKITSVIQKLIKKNPTERHSNALEIILDLGLELDLDFTKDLIPAKVFSDRKDAYNILTTYLKDRKSTEVFTIRGFDGSGKTSLLYQISEKNPQAVLIENTKTKTGIDAVKYIFKKIVFTESVLSEIEKNYADFIYDFFENSSNIVENLKQIFNTLPPGLNLIILLDDFNFYDDFTRDVLLEIIPILQVKRIKIILSESSDLDHYAAPLSNLCDIHLSQFTDHQLSEFLDLSYAVSYPKRELKKFILLYADLLPGNIKQFIKDLIILKVMRFDGGIVSFKADENIALALQSSNEEVFRLRLSNLNHVELKLAHLISAFEISVEQTVLATLMDLSQWDIKSVLNELVKKNIIDPLNISNAPQINSFSFKRYIYSTISNKTKFHVIIANALRKLFPDFSPVELSRQFELANEYEKAVEVLKKEIDNADKIFAFRYKKLTLERILKFPLSTDTINNIRYRFIQTLYKLKEFKYSIDNIYKLDVEKLSKKEKDEIIFIKGSSLVGLRKTEEGKEILTSLLSNVTNPEFRHKIMVELAYVESDLGNYEEALSKCNQIIQLSATSNEIKANCFNLSGIIEFEYKNNPKKSLENFKNALMYADLAAMSDLILKIYFNLGNISYVMSKREEAEKYWKIALEMNDKIGTLENNAMIHLSLGNYHSENLNYEKAINNWQEAEVIFITIGDRYGRALAVNNLGEVYLQTCEYQNAYEHLMLALDIFKDLNSKDDENTTLFLLGKFWFIVGHFDEFEKVFNQFEYNIFTEQNIPEKTRLLFDYMKLIFNWLRSDNQLNVLESLRLLETCKNLNEINLYTEILYFYVNFLISVHNFDEALKLLNDKYLCTIIEENLNLNAQRHYLLGKIAYSSKNPRLKSPLDYFENALALIENQSITELTWKVLYNIAEIYWERGNFNKARKPRLYAAEIINMISEHITSNKIRIAYLENIERKKALEKLKQISTQEQINELQRS